MANASLNVVITATDHASKVLADFAKNNKKTFQAFANAGKVMMGIGVGIGAAMGKMSADYSKAGEEVLAMSKKTGWATESLSELRHVAKLSETSLEALEVGLKKMSSTIVDADDGMASAALAFEKLGINLQTLKGMAPEQQFWTIANAISAIEDPTLKSALAVDIFGRSGTDMLPMLSESTAAIDAMKQQAHDLNLVFDKESAEAADAFSDSKEVLLGALTGLGNAVATIVMPDIQKLMDGLTTIVQKFGEWTKAHPELVKALEMLVPVLIGAGGLLMALGQVSKAIIGINTALTIMQALTGPRGWIILGASIGAAALAMKGMSALMEGGTGTEAVGEVWNDATQEWEPKASMASGGIVPGPVGAPVPIIAHGGEAFAGVGGFGTNVTVNVYGSVTSEYDLADTIREQLLKLKGRNVTTGL
jgi:hypothetical protein